MSDARKISLPLSWEIARIADVADVNPRLDKSEIDDQLEVSFVPMPAVEADTGHVDVSGSRPFSEVKKGYTPFLEGDVLFAKITPCMENGKMAVAPRLINGHGFGSTEFHVLRPLGGTSAKFLYYFVSSHRVRHDAEHNMTGAVGQRRVPTSYLAEYLIPIPPVAEQRRIVTKIEELFSELDKGIESLTTAREQLRTYRHAVLKHAFEGKLTNGWRAKRRGRIEPAKQVLERLRIEKSRRTKSRKEIPHLTEEQIAELPILPQEWAWCKLNELAVKITDGEHFRPETKDQGVYFLSAKDVREGGVSLGNPLFVDEETARKARLRCDPEKGDVLIVSRGATVGRMCVVNIEDVFCLLGSVILIKVASGVSTSFLTSALKSPRINRAIVTTSGSTAQQAIYLRDVQHVAVPICSAEEQSEIARLLEEKLSKADALELAIASELMRAESLRQSILRQAFSGQLVAQDDNDEPASNLLERIGAGREQPITGQPRDNKKNKKEAA